MKYSLNIGERFQIINLLPKKGNVLTMQDVQDLQRNLLPTPKEREKYGVVADEGMVRWSPDMALDEVEIDFTAPQVGLVANALRELDKKSELIAEQLSLWAKFIGGSNASK